MKRYVDPYTEPVYFGLTMAEFAEVLKALEARRTSCRVMNELFANPPSGMPEAMKHEAAKKRACGMADLAVATSASVQLAFALQGVEDELMKAGRLNPDLRLSPVVGHEDRITPEQAADMRRRASDAMEAYDAEDAAADAAAGSEPNSPTASGGDLATMKPAGRA